MRAASCGFSLTSCIFFFFLPLTCFNPMHAIYQPSSSTCNFNVIHIPCDTMIVQNLITDFCSLLDQILYPLPVCVLLKLPLLSFLPCSSCILLCNISPTLLFPSCFSCVCVQASNLVQLSNGSHNLLYSYHMKCPLKKRETFSLFLAPPHRAVHRVVWK